VVGNEGQHVGEAAAEGQDRQRARWSCGEYLGLGFVESAMQLCPRRRSEVGGAVECGAEGGSGARRRPERCSSFGTGVRVPQGKRNLVIPVTSRPVLHESFLNDGPSYSGEARLRDAKPFFCLYIYSCPGHLFGPFNT
jgi:hypothetical protein